jgi:hypothetical protein
LGGWWAALSTLTLCLCSDLFLYNTTGGLARNFSLPLTAILAWGLVTGRIGVIAMVTIISAGFYYVTAVISGISMTLLLLFFPKRLQGNCRKWKWTQKIKILGITGIVCVLIFLPGFLSGKKYGPMITAAQYQTYPEAGLEGRYSPKVQGVVMAVLRWTVSPFQGEKTLAKDIFSLAPDNPYRKGFLLSLLGIIGVGLWHYRSHEPFLRLLIAPMVAVLGYQTAVFFSPYLFFPVRYVQIVLPIAIVILLPLGLILFLNPGRKKYKANQTGLFVLLACLILGLLFSQRDSRVGLTIKIPAQERPLLTYLATLPKESLFAGWPEGVLDTIPYVTGRGVLVNWETHQVFHQGYVETQREKLFAVIDALYCIDPAPLLKLQNQFGVTHLVVEPDRIYKNIPDYFPPFDQYVRNSVAQLKNNTPLVLKLLTAQTYVQGEKYRVIDLDKIDSIINQPLRKKLSP